MKHLISILLIFLTGITACQRHTAYPPAMQQAEALMNTRPDSALTLLQGMADTLAMLPEEARMYHSLLTIQAKDKLYITHTSDSLINRIVTFYENYGDNDRLMMTYFYQGSTYRDMNDAPRALKAFHQAIDAGKDTENLTLLGQTYGQMGTLFSYQKLYDEALEVTQKALQLYTLQEDSTRYPYLNRDIARIYSAKEKNDSALHYYKKAFRFATDMKLLRQQKSIMSEMGCLYCNIGDTITAKKLLKQSLTGNRQMSNALYKLGLIYMQEERPDSARLFLEAALKKGDISTQCYVYFYLSKLEADRNKALKYKAQYEILKDSMTNIIQSETTEKLHLMYRFQRSEKDNAALRLMNEQKQSQVYLLLLVCLMALFIIFICLAYAKKNKLEVLVQAEKYRKHNAQQQMINAANIRKNAEQIKRLEIELKDSQVQKDTLHHQLLATQKELMELANKHSEATKKKRQVQDAIFYQTDICKHFRQAEMGKMEISDKDWKTLENTIEAYYPLFSKSLKDLYLSMNEREFKICLMIKATLTIKGISNIMKCDSTTISKARKRLYIRITGNEGSSKDLDKFISDL